MTTAQFDLTRCFGYPYTKDKGAGWGAPIVDHAITLDENPPRSTVAKAVSYTRLDVYKRQSQKNQLLNGEYGAWRSIGLHTEPAAFDANDGWSEERMCRLMETKIRLAEQAKDSVCGQFQWIFSSHDNPGRRQPDEAMPINR